MTCRCRVYDDADCGALIGEGGVLVSPTYRSRFSTDKSVGGASRHTETAASISRPSLFPSRLAAFAVPPVIILVRAYFGFARTAQGSSPEHRRPQPWRTEYKSEMGGCVKKKRYSDKGNFLLQCAAADVPARVMP